MKYNNDLKNIITNHTHYTHKLFTGSHFDS